MKAITYAHYGSPDVLRYSDLETPTPSSKEVLIRVDAAGVNPYDWHFLRGTPGFIRLFTGLRHPKTPRLGADVAGTVESVGSEVTGLQAGDAVFGTCKGSFAEFACASLETLALRPEGVSSIEAAAVPIAAVTALQALRDVAHLQPGQSLLINGAAGGVGTFAVQVAHWLGARTTGVCSTRNLELVRSLGAEEVIDYTCQDFTDRRSRYDVLFDLVGNRPLQALRRSLAPTGMYIGCGGGGPDRSSASLLGRMVFQSLVSPFSRQKLTGVFAKVKSEDLKLLGELIESKTIAPVIDRTYSLVQTADAIRYVEQGHARGKVVITVV